MRNASPGLRAMRPASRPWVRRAGTPSPAGKSSSPSAGPTRAARSRRRSASPVSGVMPDVVRIASIRERLRSKGVRTEFR